MKIIHYLYFFNFINCEKKCPEIDPHNDSIRVMVFPLALLLSSCIFQVLVQFDVLNSILQNWPYDYGNVHSKNFIAPTSILFIVCYLIARKILQLGYLREKFFDKGKDLFQVDESNLKVHFVLIDILIFYFIFIGIFMAFGLFKTLLVALLPLACLEFWIRKKLLKTASNAC